MDRLSLDYAGLMSSFQAPPDVARVGAALLTAFADRYQARHGECALHQFERAGAWFLFDLASSANLPQEDRTVAAVSVCAYRRVPGGRMSGGSQHWAGRSSRSRISSGDRGIRLPSLAMSAPSQSAVTMKQSGWWYVPVPGLIST
jgi:hypothetical protein